MGFAERIQRRNALWWGKDVTWRHRLHRLKEAHTVRSKNDPGEKWRCCEFWQRALSNKLNAREFAQKHRCRVPTLYWHGRTIWSLPLDSLPEHYVIKPVWGHSARGVYAMSDGTELLGRQAFTPEELKARLRRSLGWVSRYPLLIEEFVRTESGEYRLPIEYSCHVFGATIGAIETLERPEWRESFFTEDWQPFDHAMLLERHWLAPEVRNPKLPPPACLDEMLQAARRLGTAYGTYVRVDLYATDRGCVFGEFSATPQGGNGFSEYANRYFDGLWREAFPDQV